MNRVPKWKVIDDRFYGTTTILVAGRKIKRWGLPPRRLSRWRNWCIRGTNLIGEPYDICSGNNWNYYKQDWATFVKPWANYVNKWDRIYDLAMKERTENEDSI